MALATWLHVTASIYWAGAQMVFLLASRQKRPLVIYSALYIGLVVPFLVLLGREIAGQGGLPSDGMSADFIYSIIRNPHHVAPFSSLAQLSAWLPGMASLGLFMLGLIGVIWRQNRCPGGLLAWSQWPMVAALFAVTVGVLLALPVSALDATTGFWGKFYLFRPSALLLLLGCLMGFGALWDCRADKPVWRRGGYLLVGILIVLGLARPLSTKYLWLAQQQHDPQWPVMVAWLDQNGPADGPADGIVLVPPAMDWSASGLAFSRWLERPTLVNFKFSPTVAADLFEWMRRLNFRANLYQHGCHLPLKYPVRHIIVYRAQPLPPNCGPVVGDFGPWAIIAVSP